MKPTRPKWAVLVYMGADDPEDNDLPAAAFEDIKEMQSVGSSNAVRVGVQIDLRLFSPVRFSVDSDGIAQDIERRRESSTGQPGTLTSFLKWAEKTFDAERYLLVLWGHGVGIGFQLEEPVSFADAVFDDTDGLDVQELAGALRRFKQRRQGRPLDLLGFDACYMSGIEVAYEVRDLADCLVGGQASLPLAGWPYTPVLRLLKANPRQSTRRLGMAIARAVVASFGGRINLTQTALAPSAATDVAPAFRGLVAAMRALPPNGRERRAIRLALKRTSFLEARQFVDLLDLCRRVRAATRERSIRESADVVIAALTGASPNLIISHRSRGRQAARLNGVSIYLRSVRASRKGEENVNARIGKYRRLAFVKTTGWQRFVDTLSRPRADTA